MTRVTTSTMQGICALALIALAGVASAQGSGARDRKALGRTLKDSLRVVLTTAVSERAFPGAYAIVGDSRGVLAAVGAGRLDWAKYNATNEQSVLVRVSLWELEALN